ncbi:putative Arylmalonate decarboxylase [Mesorhizobium metallidurans STM 2683]|uniref:Putative Arylmalonate decarboxylase n=1 Tax=Mesorhizobium metallidurans STM 2683 TaxID=1297569 RepID=M5EYX8_9HYPH|nr:aspartate/glutamate racemase family protein [Mesorhizobium metallidurans]CCV09268.1 putative Arylmalonate decarboxylase [Mesorhizobium metallidurans STM 2683]
MNSLRIGIIYPSDGTLDREFWHFAPSIATIHVTRVRFPEGPVSAEMYRSQINEPDLEQAAEALRPISPAAVAYACTSVSFIGGHAGDRSLLERISHGAKAPTTSTSSAIVAACEALGITKIALGAPYHAEVTEEFVRYLGEAGVVSLSTRSLELGAKIGDVEAAAVMQLAKETDVPEAEAVVLACTALQTQSAITLLERVLNKPVITANQATVWHACRIAGYRGSDGVGRLWGAQLAQK